MSLLWKTCVCYSVVGRQANGRGAPFVFTTNRMPPGQVEPPLEKDIQRQCLDYLAAINIFAWRNNQIPVPLKDGGFRRFTGLKGVSDILGMLTQNVVLQDGTRAVFGNILAVEVKRPGKYPTPEQEDFLRKVNERGGVGIVVHSVDELRDELGRYL